MSIYATWLSLDEDHEDECAVWVEDPPGSGCFDLDGTKDCTCGLPNAPFIYEGSHHLPSESDPKTGYLEFAGIPDHISRDDHPEGREGQRKSFLRLSVGNEPSTTRHEGKPYIQGGYVQVVLHRRHVERLRDNLTAWLEAEEVY